MASILYLSQFRAGLIDARAQSLLVQAEIIAGAIAASATVETNTITIDPDRLLDLKPGETYRRAGRIFRARFSDQSGARRAGAAHADLADQDPRPHLRPRRRADPRQPQPYGRGDVLRFELPPPSSEKPGIAERAMIAIRTWLNRGDLPLYRELGPENGNGYEEVAQRARTARSAAWCASTSAAR